MVEYAINYNFVFHALADETRRDILKQVIVSEKTITEIAEKYSTSFAAIAKHLAVLESAALIIKSKQGRTQIITVNQNTISRTTHYLQQYENMWDQRFNKLENILKEVK